MSRYPGHTGGGSLSPIQPTLERCPFVTIGHLNHKPQFSFGCHAMWDVCSLNLVNYCLFGMGLSAATSMMQCIGTRRFKYGVGYREIFCTKTKRFYMQRNIQNGVKRRHCLWYFGTVRVIIYFNIEIYRHYDSGGNIPTSPTISVSYQNMFQYITCRSECFLTNLLRKSNFHKYFAEWKIGRCSTVWQDNFCKGFIPFDVR